MLENQHVKQALQAIHLQGANPMQIKIANDYLSNCEKIPLFSTILIKIYSEASQYGLQMSSLLLLTNVIKRNWNNKRSASKQKTLINEQEKLYLRKIILQIYSLHDMQHYKHFNNLVSYLTRMDFPLEYPELYNFVVNSLTELIKMMKNNPQEVINNKIVLTFLSTCKVILKQYHKKKISHNEDIFINYIANIIQLSVSLSEQFTSKISVFMQSNNGKSLIKLFEYLRKIDKIIMHSIGCMPLSYQYKPQIQNIVGIIFKKLSELNNFLMNFKNNSLVSIQIEKYLLGILELMTQTQNVYPLLFIQFLEEYFHLILNMLLKCIPQNYYTYQRLLTTIVEANFKPFTCFAYYFTHQQFKQSIYARKKGDMNVDVDSLQMRAHQIFKQTYNNIFVVEMLKSILTEVMTSDLVLEGHKEFEDELVLEDVEIAIVDHFNEQTVYQNCRTLLKNMIKCFKNQLLMIISQIIRNILGLKDQKDRKSQQIISNAFQLLLILPFIYGSDEISSFQIAPIIQIAYESQQFTFLSRIIRKYHAYLPKNIVGTAFNILARIVSSPSNDVITPEVIYQSALGLKTLLAQLDDQMIPVDILSPCIQNIVNLINEKRFRVTPPLMWPIINLLIRLIQSIGNISRPQLQKNAVIIINGISSLLSSEQNEELIIGALSELLTTLIHTIFDYIKSEYPIRGKPYSPCEKIVFVNNSCLVIYEATYMIIKNNLHNKSLDNYDTIFKLWLSLLRNYPSSYQQELYGFNLSNINSLLKELFMKEYNFFMTEDPIICIELLEEYYINQLIKLSQSELLNIFNQYIDFQQAIQSNLRVLMASLSLYYSYALFNAHIKEVMLMFFKILTKLIYKISPSINCFRSYLYLVLGHYLLSNNALQFYTYLTNIYNGNFLEWFKPYVTGMQFVTNKFAFKLNSSAIFQAISVIGIPQYLQLLIMKDQNQFAIDWVLKIINFELKEVRIEFTYNSYNNIFRTILPNELNPQNYVSSYKKVKFHLEDVKLVQIAQNNLEGTFRNIFSEIFKLLDWSSADIQQRIGERNALELCGLLGWQKKIV